VNKLFQYDYYYILVNCVRFTNNEPKLPLTGFDGVWHVNKPHSSTCGCYWTLIGQLFSSSVCCHLLVYLVFLYAVDAWSMNFQCGLYISIYHPWLQYRYHLANSNAWIYTYSILLWQL